MMKATFPFYLAACTVFALLAVSCKRYLDIKPDRKLAVPETLADLQALLDNSQVMNAGFPALGEETTDNWYLPTDRWLAFDVDYRANYCFVHYETRGGAWVSPYQTIYYANLALEGLTDYVPLAAGHYDPDHIAGSAYFYRAHAYYHLAQSFAAAYDPDGDNEGLGIVLRSRASVDEPLHRASVGETYAAMMDDLERAAALLPMQPSVPTRPGRPAAWALLARIYLLMADFDRSLAYVDSALAQHNHLIHYSTLDSLSNSPFRLHNPEVLFHSRFTTAIMVPNRGNIDQGLLDSYATGDLRKALFFRRNTDGSYRFKGSYDGSTSGLMFNGVSSGELYLIKSECLARLNRSPEALKTLDALLQNRWRTGDYTPIDPGTVSDPLALILAERRKELPYRCLRWPDLRRLSLEGRYTGTIVREVDGNAYRLAAGDMPGYHYRLPPEAVQQGGYPQ